MRHFLPVVLAVALACCVITQLPAATAAGADATPQNSNQGGNTVYCNCTEWSCPRSSNYFCPPGPSCQHGVCKPIVAPDGSACRVSNKCEVDPGTCVAGVCKGKYQKICPANPNECKVYTCSTATGNCDLVDNKPDGTPCKGGSCVSGDCIPGTKPSPKPSHSPRPPPSPKPCKPPKNPCKVSIRDPKTGKCKVQNAGEGTSCLGHDKCTVGAVCKKGKCQGSPKKCTSTNPCKQSACNPDNGRCKLTNLPDNTICPNGTCSAGVCTQPIPQSCNITTDACKEYVYDPTQQQCILKNIIDGTSCNDGLNCTTGDQCKSGICIGTQVTCPDTGNQCTVSQCNPGTGACEVQNVAGEKTCDDGLYCTDGDICVNGMCSGNPITCPASTNQCQVSVCDESSNTCTYTNKTDGSACSTNSNSKCATEVCMGGQCVVSKSTDCSCYGDACNIGQCDDATGKCVKVPKTDGISCEDGLLCTMNTTCKKGVCQGDSPTCPPSNSTTECGSTIIVCSELYYGQCLTIKEDLCSKLSDQCNIGICDTSAGKCKLVPKNNGQPCDDGKYCTTGDKCNCGTCQGTPVSCPTTSPVGQCQKVECSEGAKGCKVVNQDNGYPCTTPNGKCSSDTCQAGVCTAGPLTNCTANLGPCKKGVCDPKSGCQIQNLPNGTLCDDGKFCTQGTMCMAGECTGGTATVCTPKDKCQVATCDAATNQCQSTAVNCSYLDSTCQKGVCDPVKGCIAQPSNTGATCTNPNLYCKVQTTCQPDGSCGGGVDRDCSGAVPALVASDKCTIATCDECKKKCTVKTLDCTDQGDQCNAGQCGSDGKCTSVPKANGTECNDNNENTCKDVCTNGVCAGTVQDCQSPPATCQDSTDCAANMCCCGDDKKPKQCVPKLGNDCGFTCAEQACMKSGSASGLVCNCIKSCGVKGGPGGDKDKSPNCDSQGGNPCASQGVCCCAVNKPQTSVGFTFEDACPNCETPCTGSGKVCTGDSADTIQSICKAPLPLIYPPAGSRTMMV